MCIHVCLFLHISAISNTESLSSHMLGKVSATELDPKLRKCFSLDGLLNGPTTTVIRHFIFHSKNKPFDK